MKLNLLYLDPDENYIAEWAVQEYTGSVEPGRGLVTRWEDGTLVLTSKSLFFDSDHPSGLLKQFKLANILCVGSEEIQKAVELSKSPRSVRSSTTPSELACASTTSFTTVNGKSSTTGTTPRRVPTQEATSPKGEDEVDSHKETELSKREKISKKFKSLKQKIKNIGKKDTAKKDDIKSKNDNSKSTHSSQCITTNKTDDSVYQGINNNNNNNTFNEMDYVYDANFKAPPDHIANNASASLVFCVKSFSSMCPSSPANAYTKVSSYTWVMFKLASISQLKQMEILVKSQRENTKLPTSEYNRKQQLLLKNQYQSAQLYSSMYISEFSERKIADFYAELRGPFVRLPVKIVLTTSAFYMLPLWQTLARDMVKLPYKNIAALMPRWFIGFNAVEVVVSGRERDEFQKNNSPKHISSGVYPTSECHKYCMDAPFPNTIQAIRPYTVNPTVLSSELLGTKSIFYDLSHLSFLFQPPFSPSSSDTAIAQPCPGPIIDSYFLSFVTTEERNSFIATLVKADQRIPYTSSDGSLSTLKLLTEAWSKGVVSNFEYLLAIGFLAGRSPSVLSQYPIMPWVIGKSGYGKDDTTLDLASIELRDLAKPMGAIDPTRLEKYKERMRFMESMDKRGSAPAREVKSSPSPQLHTFPPLQPVDMIYNIVVKELYKEQQLMSSGRESEPGSMRAGTNDGGKSPSNNNLINIHRPRESSVALSLIGHSPGLESGCGAVTTKLEDVTEHTLKSLVALLDFPPHLYPIHFSAQGHVLYYLHRKAHEYHLRLQQGVLDCANRLFYSVDECFNTATHSLSDVKELIPEFFSGNGDFLANIGAQWMGRRTGGERVSGVVLPGWANNSPELFVVGNRLVIESERVSKEIPNWIDLMYGYKSRGKDALDANNLFHPLSYPGYVDFDALRVILGVTSPKSGSSIGATSPSIGMSPTSALFGPTGTQNSPVCPSLATILSDKDKVEELWGLWNASVGHVYEFGVMPDQLFHEPHPKREVGVSDCFAKYESNEYILPTTSRDVPLDLKYLVIGKNVYDNESTDLDSVGTGGRHGEDGTKYNINSYGDDEDEEVDQGYKSDGEEDRAPNVRYDNEDFDDDY